jgi:hypothetical protein
MRIDLDFTQDNIDIDLWRVGHAWGNIHPEFPYQYYSDREVRWKGGTGLILGTSEANDVEVFDSNGVGHFPDCSVGLVSSKFGFKYGRLEVTAILPEGHGLWPAIWTTAVDSWPPEIDLVEGYSENRSNYGNWLIPGFRLQTNVHYRDKEMSNRNIKGRNHCVFKNPIKKETKFTLVWSEKSIKIYYDNRLVRCVKNKEVLSSFNQSRGQYIVLNNAIQPGYWIGGNSQFIIKRLCLESSDVFGID